MYKGKRQETSFSGIYMTGPEWPELNIIFQAARFQKTHKNQVKIISLDYNLSSNLSSVEAIYKFTDWSSTTSLHLRLYICARQYVIWTLNHHVLYNMYNKSTGYHVQHLEPLPKKNRSASSTLRIGESIRHDWRLHKRPGETTASEPGG